MNETGANLAKKRLLIYATMIDQFIRRVERVGRVKPKPIYLALLSLAVLALTFFFAYPSEHPFETWHLSSGNVARDFSAANSTLGVHANKPASRVSTLIRTSHSSKQFSPSLKVPNGVSMVCTRPPAFPASRLRYHHNQAGRRLSSKHFNSSDL